MDFLLNETCLLRTVIYNSRDAIICLLRLNKKKHRLMKKLCTVNDSYVQFTATICNHGTPCTQ